MPRDIMSKECGIGNTALMGFDTVESVSTQQSEPVVAWHQFRCIWVSDDCEGVR